MSLKHMGLISYTVLELLVLLLLLEVLVLVQ